MMKHRKIKFPGIDYIFMFFLVLSTFNSNAQPTDCKQTLDEMNSIITGIPDQKINTYETCLKKIEEYYAQMKTVYNSNINNDSKKIEIEKNIANFKKDSTKSKNSLDQATRKNIRDSITYYNNIQENINNSLDDLYNNLNKIIAGYNLVDEYRTTLAKSYNKLIEYYDLRNTDAKKRLYQAKLQALK